MNPLCYLCFMFIFVMLSCLFLAALCSPAGKGLTSWFSCMCVFSRVFVTFLYGVPGRVWCLIVLIPDLCFPLLSKWTPVVINARIGLYL